VSNTVLLVEAGGCQFVVKQALPQLRVEAEWLCDRRRILSESAALRAVAPVLPAGAVPVVLCEDPANFAFAMSAAPSAETWKARLLRGECDIAIAERAGATLSALIRGTSGSAALASRFDQMAIFDQLRLDPYYRYTAARHPDLAGWFQSLIEDCECRRFCLVHGDFSPKNFLVDGDSAIAIDWECVHYGNPAFDAAFLLNHLLLKSFHRPADAPEFGKLAARFWESLRAGAPSAPWLEESTIRHWAGLLLARMDGKSPVEYIAEPERKEQIRRFARRLMTNPPRCIAAVFDRRIADAG
jgi:aminoglycoside phosphotransferase (APT) family kinase protein